MAKETTPLLNFCVINIPNMKETLMEIDKTKGLSLEELMPFDTDPWWQNVRKTFMLSFWVALFIIFATACIISIGEHGSCRIITKYIIANTTQYYLNGITTENSIIKFHSNQSSHTVVVD